MSADRRYVVISPSRDEARYARRTLESVLNQTVPPTLWVIVDDGSTDDTPRILDEYARHHQCIRIVRRDDRGERSVGPGVVEAFYAGYETVNLDDFDYLCKLDLDLDLPSRYFETLIERMESEPRLGTCSGKPCARRPGGGLVLEPCGDEMSVGMTKFYRIACFQEIGGFIRHVMWDGIDCHRCRLLGWLAGSFDEPDLRFIHLRAMGSSQKSILAGRARHGFGQYYMGTGLAYMTASALYRMTRPPKILGGAAMLWGYVRSMVARKPRYQDREFRRFLRRYQWDCLLRGKERATQRVNQRQASRWRPRVTGSPITI